MLITYFRSLKKYNNYLDIYDNFDKINLEKPDKYRHTYTEVATEEKAMQVYERHNYRLPKLSALADEAQSLIDSGLVSFYISFLIPKKRGGFRTIEAPQGELSTFLRKVKDYFEKELRWLPHDAAYAYVKHRSCKDVLEYHQKHSSRWFLKIDIKDFFGSCTEEYLHDMLKDVYPFGILMKDYGEQLTKIVSTACLNGKLPQGTPLSPLLSNMAFTKYDYAIADYCRRNHLVYTRYADDLLISGEMKFNWQYTLQTIKDILADSPFQLNTQKTRFGSYSGRNWNLGLMYNKDMNITVGHEKKNKMKVMLNHVFKAYENNVKCDNINLDSLNGLLNYYKHIEPEYFNRMLNKFECKYNIKWEDVILYVR